MTTTPQALLEQITQVTHRLNVDTPDYHNKVTGDVIDLTEYLEKHNLARVLDASTGRHEVISVEDLIPLESQRNAKTAWIKKALKLSGGFDTIAAGIIQVARDPSTGINYVWDGCGRLALAQAAGVSELNCWVVDLSPKTAAHYFVYTQKTSNRNLSADELFINAYETGEDSALDFADVLYRLGMRIQGADDYWVPQVRAFEKSNFPKCNERSVRHALRLANGDESVVRFARDTIVNAGWNDDMIRKDLLPGLVLVYMAYPELMKNGLSKSLSNYFVAIANIVTQGKLQFKQMGGNMHNREVESVAVGIIRGFRDSPLFKPHYSNVITLKRIQEYAGIDTTS
jgi:hypothetical protein